MNKRLCKKYSIVSKVLYHCKITKCIFDCFYLFWCRMFPRLFQFFYRIRSIIHRQSQISLYLCDICGMYLEAVFRFYVLLNHFVGHFFFGLVRFGSFSNTIYRNLALALSKLHINVDITVGFFVGQKNYRLYAICKNEEKFVDGWMDSMGEADLVVVLDTGSEDGTVERLRARGAQVTVERILPWRFDAARNRSLELVPEDVDLCVCADLDEAFHPGWREALERAWRPGCGRASYRYTWSFQQDGSEGVVFWSDKIHARRGYRWVHPVHEVLQWEGEGAPGPTVAAEGIQLDHHPDPEKSRGQYLPLLELSVEEDPEDDRNMHYLGREYLFRGRWEECIRTLERHLAMPQAVWRDERAASMRFLARACLELDRQNEALEWYLRAAAEAPYLREPWVELARLLYQREEWDGVLYAAGQALAVQERPRTYICEPEAWGSLPHDLRCQAFYHTGRTALALEEARRALALSPEDGRLRENVELLERQMRHTEASTPY